MEDRGDHVLLQDADAGVLEEEGVEGRDSEKGGWMQERELRIGVEVEAAEGRQVPEGGSIYQLEEGTVVDEE